MPQSRLIVKIWNFPLHLNFLFAFTLDVQVHAVSRAIDPREVAQGQA